MRDGALASLPSNGSECVLHRPHDLNRTHSKASSLGVIKDNILGVRSIIPKGPIEGCVAIRHVFPQHHWLSGDAKSPIGTSRAMELTPPPGSAPPAAAGAGQPGSPTGTMLTAEEASVSGQPTTPMEVHAPPTPPMDPSVVQQGEGPMEVTAAAAAPSAMGAAAASGADVGCLWWGCLL